MEANEFLKDITIENIEIKLIETMADFLDEIEDDEIIAGIKSSNEKREVCDLHIRMANAALNEYKNNLSKI